MRNRDTLATLLDPDHSADAPADEKLWAAVVSRAPTSLDDTIDVTVSAIDGSVTHIGPCPWMPRGTRWPAAGALVLLAFDQDGGAWALAWHGPYTSH